MEAETSSARGSSLRGPWYVTRAAAEQYSRMMGGGDSQEELDEAREDLIQAARSAHHVEGKRVDRKDVEVWRASPEWHRFRFYVAKPNAGQRDGLPALIRVLSPYDGWQPDGQDQGEIEMKERDEPESERSRDAIASVIEKVVAGMGLAERQRALAVALWRTAANHPMIGCCADFAVKRVVLEDGGARVTLEVETFPPR